MATKWQIMTYTWIIQSRISALVLHSSPSSSSLKVWKKVMLLVRGRKREKRGSQMDKLTLAFRGIEPDAKLEKASWHMRSVCYPLLFIGSSSQIWFDLDLLWFTWGDQYHPCMSTEVRSVGQLEFVREKVIVKINLLIMLDTNWILCLLQ